MSTVPASEPAAKRRIGDILLAHDFVSEAQLADATAEQERTGQPLGQILVQHGSITRLELASALAEQWSEPSASISLAPRPVTSLPPPTPQDEAQYAARLQEAVAALARKVQSSEPLEGIDERVTDLARRIESTLARTQHIEAAVATLADSLEGVTGGVEEAFVALQAGTSELAAEFARIDKTVGELALQSVGPQTADPELLAEVEELRSAVAALAAQPTGVEVVSQRLEEIASRFDTLVDAAALDDLRGALRELESRANDLSTLDARLDHVEALATDESVRQELGGQAAALAELREVVSELAVRPSGTAELDLRLQDLEARLETAVARIGDTAGVDALAARLEAASIDHETLAASVEQLDFRVGALPLEDGRVGGVLERLEGLEDRLDHQFAGVEELRGAVAAAAASGRVEELSLALDLVRDELAALASSSDPDPALAAQIAELTAQVEQLAASTDHSALTERLEALDARVSALPLEDGRVGGVLERLEGLEDRLDHQFAGVEELRGAVAAAAASGRVEELSLALDLVRDELAALASSRDPDPALAAQIEELTAQVEQLAASTDHSALTERLEALERRPTDGFVTREALADALEHVRPESPAVLDGRFEELSLALALVRDELAALASSRDPDPALAAQIEELTAQVEQLAASTDHSALTERLEALERRPTDGFVTREALADALEHVRPESPAVLDGRIEELAEEFEALRNDLSGASVSSSATPGLADEIERVALQVEDLARHHSDAGALAEKLEALESARDGDLDTIGVLARALDRIRHDLTSAREHPDGQVSAITGTVGELAERLARLEALAESAPAGAPTHHGLESELEHVRLAIERLGLHLAEHDRTLATLQHARGLTTQVEELAARVEALAAPASHGEPDAGATVTVVASGDVQAIVRRVEEAEIASQADREKLMNRLERLAASMDWRLQRLEADDSEE